MQRRDAEVPFAGLQIMMGLNFEPSMLVVAITVPTLIALELDDLANFQKRQLLSQAPHLSHQRLRFRDFSAIGRQAVMNGQTHCLSSQGYWVNGTSKLFLVRIIECSSQALSPSRAADLSANG